MTEDRPLPECGDRAHRHTGPCALYAREAPARRSPVPEGWEFRLSPDRSLFAFYDPGNGPWFVPEPAMRGRFVDSADMDALGWHRFVPAPGEASDAERAAAVASILRHTANTVDLEDLPQTAEDTADFCDGARWATAKVRKIADEVAADNPDWRPDGFTERAAGLGLNSAERAMLRYALEIVEDRIASEGDEFTDAEDEAVTSLKRLAGEDTATRAPDRRRMLSEAAGLGTDAPWDEVRDRVGELHAEANGPQYPERPCHEATLHRKPHPVHVYRFQRAESYWCPGLTEDEANQPKEERN